MENQLLRKMQSSYKLIIPQHVERKFRTLLTEIYNTEWSGVLFYTYEGSIKNNDLVLTCQDVLPMDIGNQVYTEWGMDADVASYMVDHDLLDCQLAAVHSHHSMATCPSGTDLNTLYEEGKERNNFLSLIVNNARTYSAFITEKEVQTVTKHISKRVPFFDNQGIDSQEEDVCEEVVTVNYYPLEIEFPVDSEDTDELLDRILELKIKNENKAKVKTFPTSCPANTHTSFVQEEEGGAKLFDDAPFRISKPAQTFPTVVETSSKGKEMFAEEGPVDMEYIEEITAKLITGNILITRLPQDMNSFLPKLNRMWQEACDDDPRILDSLIDDIITAVVPVVYGTERYVEACIKEIEKITSSKNFYAYDALINGLNNYV